jgi:nucleotide-binding universal stress UspA family protein
MKTILVATDFSPAATNAANYAADMALAINATVVLLHVYQMPVIYLEVPVAYTEEEMRQDAQKNINRLKGELLLKRGAKLKIETEIRLGEFFPVLKSICCKIEPYAVVMGSQGSTAAERILFGGHTIYAMKHLDWPLITVPMNASFSAIKKIGLACDFEKVLDTTPIEEIKILLKDFSAELHVLNTDKQTSFNPDIVFQSGILEEMLAPMIPQYHFISNDQIDEGIMDFAEKNQIDLLIVLPKKHSFFDQLIHKSHSKQLVLHSHLPVMAIHEQ